ncbi:MAG: siphovirus Gp157 family protein [Geminicoccales bacterium]
MPNAFAELAAFDRLCETMGSDLDLTDPTTIDALMEGESQLKEMAGALLDDIDEAEVLQKGLNAKIDEFKARQTVHANLIKSAKSVLFKVIEKLPPDRKGKRTLRLATATIAYTAGSKKVVITDEDALPFDMMSTSDPTPDNKAIKEELDAGRAVSGAMLSNGEPSISIRRK